MKLIKRVLADVRGPGQGKQEVENIVNEALVKLQEEGNAVLRIDEMNKDSGVTVFIITYDTIGKQPEKKPVGRPPVSAAVG